MEQEDEEEDNDEEEKEISKPSNTEMVAAFDIIRRGLQTVKNVPHDVFFALNKCEHFYECKWFNQHIQLDIRNYCITPK